MIVLIGEHKESLEIFLRNHANIIRKSITCPINDRDIRKFLTIFHKKGGLYEGF